jgi:hypothetical protein
VPDSAVGPDGRTVRCANCGYSWFQGGVELPVPPPLVTPATPKFEPESIFPGATPNLPAIIRSVPVPRLLRIATIFLFAIALCLSPLAFRKTILNAHPELGFLFGRLGIYYTGGVALADIALVKTPLEGKGVHVVLHCSVINESSGSRTMPGIIVTPLDADGNILSKSASLTQAGTNLTAGMVQPCKPYAFDLTDDSVDRLRVDLADPFDNRLRQQ